MCLKGGRKRNEGMRSSGESSCAELMNKECGTGRAGK